MKKLLSLLFLLLLCCGLVLYIFRTPLLSRVGNFLIVSDTIGHVDAAVVLATGIEYYPRLIEAATLYQEKKVDWIVINGNRKTDALRQLEAKGLEKCCPWYETSLRILALYGVPGDRVIPVSAENAYDTISEAKIVGEAILARGLSSIVVTTSTSHTRRAGHIWKTNFKGLLQVKVTPARNDPFDPEGWWHHGRQVRWVLAEYGAWGYYWWKDILHGAK
jgi:uncharacterized SAM-binding protein YcdF (DUF218 family)